MNVDQLKALCSTVAGAVSTLHEAPANILVYSVGGKNFAYFKTSEPQRWRFSTRVSAGRFIELTDMPGVKPARYMGRYHWISIVKVEQFPDDYLHELVQCSYCKALGSLSKKKQLAIHSACTPDLKAAP